jgi:predicted alpha/beta hydrolase family esterase
MKRLCIIPRWAGGPEKDYYPWLRASLDRLSPKPFIEVLSPEMPDPQTPTIAAWTSRLREIVGTDPHALAQTVLLGHSVGCQAALRFLASLPEGTHVAGTLCVAGWFGVDKPWETIKPWMDTPLDDVAVRARAGKLVVLLSDNDPFTADYKANAAAWKERLGAEVVFAPGRKHFNDAEEPAVLEALLRHFGG